MELCCGQDVNLWWGVELLIPLLKHTKYYYFCVKSICRQMPTQGKVATANVMMTMAGERGGEETARQGDGEATATATMQRRGNKDAKAIGYGAAGGRGNEAIDKRITNKINNK